MGNENGVTELNKLLYGNKEERAKAFLFFAQRSRGKLYPLVPKSITPWPNPLEPTPWPNLESLQLVHLGALKPSEVLYEFDGPRIFTAQTTNGIMVLAYLSEDLEDEQCLRYVVATTTDKIVEKLKSNAISVREALEQENLWLVDFSYRGTPMRAFSIRGDQIPEDALPMQGIKLAPS